MVPLRPDRPFGHSCISGRVAALCLGALLVGCAGGPRLDPSASARETARVARGTGGSASDGSGGADARGADRLASHAEPSLHTFTHRVEPGQTLYRIAKVYGTSVERLKVLNGIADPRALQVGQELVVEGAVAPKEVPATAQRRTSKRVVKRTTARKVPAPSTSKAVAKEGTKGVLGWPLRGILYARFGKKGSSPHDGIDLAAPLGTAVRTAAPGRVLFAGEQRGYGLIVIVDHGEGLITLYAQAQSLRVKTGQQLRRDQVIATVGRDSPGSSPHLHFEVRRNGRPIDPLELLGAPPSVANRGAL